MPSFENIIFEIKGKQYNIQSLNQVIYIDYQRERNTGDTLKFSRVLSYGNQFGSPYLENVVVTGEVIKHRKLKKITVFKYKAKKRTTKKQGVRPQYTEVKILSVEKN